jgi:D-cysteine desulfhydrase family pyridoxal phosphate-dependent enzyme
MDSKKLSVLKKMHQKKICFAGFPTPIYEMQRLSNELGGPRIFVKRDDMTDLAFGGNKARKLEFLFADALNKKANVIISVGAVQSNCACMVAAAARRLGLKPVLVLVGKEPNVYDGNLLLDNLLGAELHFIDEYGPHVEYFMEDLAKNFRNEHYRPYVVSTGASIPLTVPGYALAMEELVLQMRELEESVDYVICACGTGGTQAGLILGNKILDAQAKIFGASVFACKNEARKNIYSLAKNCSKLYSFNLSLKLGEINVFDDYIKEGYGVLNQDIVKAVKLLANTEGIFLDPIYTGKAMVMLIDLIDKQYFKKDDNIVFIHTGGLPAIFLYRNKLLLQ